MSQRLPVPIPILVGMIPSALYKIRPWSMCNIPLWCVLEKLRVWASLRMMVWCSGMLAWYRKYLSTEHDHLSHMLLHHHLFRFWSIDRALQIICHGCFRIGTGGGVYVLPWYILSSTRGISRAMIFFNSLRLPFYHLWSSIVGIILQLFRVWITVGFLLLDDDYECDDIRLIH